MMVGQYGSSDSQVLSLAEPMIPPSDCCGNQILSLAEDAQDSGRYDVYIAAIELAYAYYDSKLSHAAGRASHPARTADQ